MDAWHKEKKDLGAEADDWRCMKTKVAKEYNILKLTKNKANKTCGSILCCTFFYCL